MRRLLAAELSRLISRRLVVLVLIAVAAGVGLFQIAIYQDLSAPSASERAAAASAYASSHQEWENNRAEVDDQCTQEGLPLDQCNPEPQLADFLYQGSFDDMAAVSVSFTTYVVALGMFLAAASFIGAEYSTGSIGNWLSFVPRRLRVYAAKLLVVSGFAAVVGAVLLGVSVGFAAVIARAGGLPLTGLDHVLAQAGRAVAAPVVLAVIGFAIALAARHTAAAIGVLLGYLLVAFVRRGLLAVQGWAQELHPWSPEGAMEAYLGHGSTYQVPVVTLSDQGSSFDFVERHISFAHGLIYLIVVVVVAVVVSAAVFRRRDVA